jgi:hypothetical protein
VHARARLREPLTLTRDSFTEPGLETKRAILFKTLNKNNNIYKVEVKLKDKVEYKVLLLRKKVVLSKLRVS